MTTTVEDALHHTLRHTGYSLCPAPGPAQRTLYRKPLPAAHYRLGPMPLREALQVLGGDAWELEVDPVAREVCYQVRDIRYAPGHGDDSCSGQVVADTFIKLLPRFSRSPSACGSQGSSGAGSCCTPSRYRSRRRASLTGGANTAVPPAIRSSESRRSAP